MRESNKYVRNGLHVQFSEAVAARWEVPGQKFHQIDEVLWWTDFSRVGAISLWPSIGFKSLHELAGLWVHIKGVASQFVLLATGPDGYIGWAKLSEDLEFRLDDLRPSISGFLSQRENTEPLLVLHVLVLSDWESADEQLDRINRWFAPFRIFELKAPRERPPPFYTGTNTVAVGKPPAPSESVEQTDCDERFLQAQSFVDVGSGFQPARNGFLAGRRARVRVRIGGPNKDWVRMTRAFPVHELPQDEDGWELVVWLTEAHHFAEQTHKATIHLPREGDSTECEFEFLVGRASSFEGRITVLHQGRVLQTAVLRSKVSVPGAAMIREQLPVLEEDVRVFARMDGRRKFDLAIIQNHDSADTTRTTILSDNRAWISDTQLGVRSAKLINQLLSQVADREPDYRKGLNGPDGTTLLVNLAQKGATLGKDLMGSLASPGNRTGIAANEFIQVVNTRNDCVIPFELIYDYEVPNDGSALCEHWAEALAAGKCPNPCNEGSAEHVCPMGFWGLRKVIERHTLARQYGNLSYPVFLQSESREGRRTLFLGGTVLVAGSENVAKEMPDLVAHLQTLKVGVAHAKDWKDWPTLVGKHRPKLLLALPHTDGDVDDPTMELGGVVKKLDLVRPTDVCSKDHVPGPVVALLGCDTLTTADAYSHLVGIFRHSGAAIVIGTIATVYGKHATAVARALVTRLLAYDEQEKMCLGEVMRAVKRDGLRDNLLMPLCLVAFGDADWILSRKEISDA